MRAYLGSSPLKFLTTVLFLMSLASLHAQEVAEIDPVEPAPVAQEYDSTTPVGPHHRLLEWTEPDPARGPDAVRTVRAIQLESGLHYFEEGEWRASEEVIEIAKDGSAVARRGPVKVSFSPNAKTAGCIDLLATDGRRMRSHVLGLAYYDAESGRSVVLAEVKDCEGLLLPPNEVLYDKAFDGIEAAIRYTYRKGSFEQDVVLLEEPPSPGAFGLNPITTRLEVWTEFLDAPTPRRTSVVVKGEGDLAKRARMADPDFVDELLDFGATQIGVGKAFSADAGAESKEGPGPGDLPVFKHWKQEEGRSVLIEGLEYPAVAPQLARLPRKHAALRSDPALLRRHVAKGRALPLRQTAGISPRRSVAQWAKSGGSILSPHFVIDYYMQLNSSTNGSFTFYAGTNYLVTGAVTLSTNTTIQSGAYIKITSGGSITVSGGSFNTPTSGKAYVVAATLPAGVVIYPTNAPSSKIATTAITLSYLPTLTVRNLDFRHLTNAILAFSPSSTIVVTECVFRDCGTGVRSYAGGGYVTNNTGCNVGAVYQVASGSAWSNVQADPLTGACDDHGNLMDTATIVSLGSSTAGTIGYAGEVDFFKVVLATAVTNLNVYTTGTTDTYGYLINSSGAVLAQADSSDWGYNANFSILDSVTAGTNYVCVRHGQTSASSGDYTLYVKANNAPTISSIANQAIDEDSTLSNLPFTINDAETPPASLTVQYFSSNASIAPLSGISLGGSGTNRTISITPAPNQSGSVTITLRVSDGGLSVETTFGLTVRPQLSPPSLSTAFDWDHFQATVTGSGGGATVHYTTDGSDPTASSSTTPPVVYSPTLVKARAFATDYAPSDIASNYVGRASGVDFSPNGHLPTEFALGPTTLSLSSEPGATILYQLGSTGFSQSTSSGTAVPFDGIDNGTGVVTAYAYTATTLQSSSSQSGEFVFRLPPPTSSVAPGGYAQSTLTLSTSVAGASIRYTTDGAVPTLESSLYSGPLTLSGSVKVYAAAFKAGYVPSSYVSAWANQLPAAKIATSSGLLTSNITVNNDTEVWLVPNLGIDNAYGEERSLAGWAWPQAFASDSPSVDFPGSFIGAPGGGIRSLKAIGTSGGRTYSLGVWVRTVSGASRDYAGLMNFDRSGATVCGEDVNEEYSGGVTYLTAQLLTGATQAQVADTAAFSPVDAQGYFNLFVPLTNAARAQPWAMGNQPPQLDKLYQPVSSVGTDCPQVVSINSGTGTLQLSAPYTGPSLPTGHLVARRRASFTYQYSLYRYWLVPATWTRVEPPSMTYLHPGTESVSLLALASFSGGTSALTGFEMWEGGTGDRPRIHYRLDGNSGVYSGGLTTSGPVRLVLNGNHMGGIALGQRGTYYQDAPVVQRSVSFEVAKPTLLFWPTNATQYAVAAQTVTTGAVCRYTLDGSDPTDLSPSMSGALPFNAEQTVKIRAFRANYTPSTTVGRLGVPTFTPSSGTNGNDLTVSVNPSPGSAQLQWLRSNEGPLDSRVWVVGTYDRQGPFNPNGSPGENSIEAGEGPSGRYERIWRTHGDTASGPDGGWDSELFPVDKTKTYRLSVWLKKSGGTEGATCFGTGHSTVSALTGNTSEVVDTNPYFWWGSLALDRWYLFVTYIHPAGHTGTTHYGGVYDETGAVVSADMTNFKWLNATTVGQHRIYLYYSTNAAVRQYFADPRMEVVDSALAPAFVALGTTTTSPLSVALSGNVGNVVDARCLSSTPDILPSPFRKETFTFQAAAPSVSVDSSWNFLASTATGGTVEIRYSTSGSPPTAASPLYASGIRAPAGTSQWKAFRTNYRESAVTTYAVTDSDADGLPDGWETQWFGNLGTSGASDPEGDGWTNAQEYSAGTHPTAANLRVRVFPPRPFLP